MDRLPIIAGFHPRSGVLKEVAQVRQLCTTRCCVRALRHLPYLVVCRWRAWAAYPKHPILGWKLAGLVFLFVFSEGIGCQEKTEPTPTRSRVIGVEAKPEHIRSLDEYCDVVHAASEQVFLNVPPLDNVSLTGDKKARWINVWATWCKPCIEEMPMLVRWANRMNNNGKSVELKFISADDTAQVLSSFLAKHAEIGASFRLARSDSLQPWMSELGLDGAAGLPIHIFVEKGGFVRCVRAAAIGREDFDIIQQFF